MEKCKPGDRVKLTGCLLSIPDVPSMIKPSDLAGTKAKLTESNTEESGIHGLSKLGVRELAYKEIFIAINVEGGSTGEMVGDDDGTGIAVNKLLREIMTNDYNIEEYPILRTLKITNEQIKRFRKVSKSVNCMDRLIQHMANEIYGLNDVKKGLLLMLVAGVEKRTRKDRIKLRGDINMCLVGDPGTAKSQLLKFIQSFAERAIFASGKSSTAAGLTASVHKDPEQGESVVEAGALILADNGVCCIDEFEKMADKDMVAIHEAMEQQTISISKAGVQATMNARASVLAACNPSNGRYDMTKRLIENLKLSPTIISRFDLIFVIQDRASEEQDRKIANHILRNTFLNQENQYPLKGALLKDPEELKKYIK